MREFNTIPSGLHANILEINVCGSRAAGNPDLAASLWQPQSPDLLRQHRQDVLFTAQVQEGGRFPGVAHIADDFGEYLQQLHNGRTQDARNTLQQITRAFADQSNYGLNRPPTQTERDEFARQLIALVRNRGELHFNLNGLQFVPGTNRPSVISGTVVHDLGGGRTENIPIQIAVDDRPDVGIAAAHMSSLIARTHDQVNPMNANDLSQTERSIWRAWNGLLPQGQAQNNLDPIWTAAPQAGGGLGQPHIIAELNSRLAASHLRVEYAHRTNPLQPWLAADGWLRVTNADTGAQVGNLIYVGSLTPERRGQLAANARVQPSEGDGDPGTQPTDWWSGLPGGVQTTILATGSAATLMTLYLVMNRALPYIAKHTLRSARDRVGRAISGSASYVWNHRPWRRGDPPAGPTSQSSAHAAQAPAVAPDTQRVGTETATNSGPPESSTTPDRSRRLRTTDLVGVPEAGSAEPGAIRVTVVSHDGSIESNTLSQPMALAAERAGRERLTEVHREQIRTALESELARRTELEALGNNTTPEQRAELARLRTRAELTTQLEYLGSNQWRERVSFETVVEELPASQQTVAGHRRANLRARVGGVLLGLGVIAIATSLFPRRRESQSHGVRPAHQ